MLFRAGRFAAISGLLLIAATSARGASPAGELPKFRIKLLDKTILNSDDLRDKLAVIDFWGTWCKPCLEEIPQYNSFYADYREKGILFVAVAVESGSESKVRKDVKRLGINYPVYVHQGRQPDPFADVGVYPTTWLIQNGRIVKEFVGTPAGKHRDLREWADKALAGN